MLIFTTHLGYGIPLRDGDEKTDEEAEGPYSDDEMLFSAQPQAQQCVYQWVLQVTLICAGKFVL